MVSENDLKYMAIDDLIDLMVKSINERLVWQKMKDKENMTFKTQEIKLIQKIIAYKRNELMLVKQ
jgi:hypothetical protein